MKQVESRAMHPKLDPYAYVVLCDHPAGLVGVLLETTDELTCGQRQQLADKGCQVSAVVGRIVSAQVPVERLEEMCDLGFIIRVEISRPKYPNSKE